MSRRRHHFLAFGALQFLAACSLLVNMDKEQCARNEDCRPFPGTVCAVAQHVCVKEAAKFQLAPDAGATTAVDPKARNESGSSIVPSSDGDSTMNTSQRDGGWPDSVADDVAVDGCRSSSGCFSCAPSGTIEFLNACTNSECSPFDNRILRHLLPDGALPPLPILDGGLVPPAAHDGGP